jgi:hypothetical protein
MRLHRNNGKAERQLRRRAAAEEVITLGINNMRGESLYCITAFPESRASQTNHGNPTVNHNICAAPTKPGLQSSHELRQSGETQRECIALSRWLAAAMPLDQLLPAPVARQLRPPGRAGPPTPPPSKPVARAKLAASVSPPGHYSYGAHQGHAARTGF